MLEKRGRRRIGALVGSAVCLVGFWARPVVAQTQIALGDENTGDSSSLDLSDFSLDSDGSDGKKSGLSSFLLLLPGLGLAFLGGGHGSGGSSPATSTPSVDNAGSGLNRTFGFFPSALPSSVSGGANSPGVVGASVVGAAIAPAASDPGGTSTVLTTTNLGVAPVSAPVNSVGGADPTSTVSLVGTGTVPGTNDPGAPSDLGTSNPTAVGPVLGPVVFTHPLPGVGPGSSHTSGSGSHGGGPLTPADSPEPSGIVSGLLALGLIGGGYARRRPRRLAR